MRRAGRGAASIRHSDFRCKLVKKKKKKEGRKSEKIYFLCVCMMRCERPSQQIYAVSYTDNGRARPRDMCERLTLAFAVKQSLSEWRFLDKYLEQN